MSKLLRQTDAESDFCPFMVSLYAPARFRVHVIEPRSPSIGRMITTYTRVFARHEPPVLRGLLRVRHPLVHLGFSSTMTPHTLRDRLHKQSGTHIVGIRTWQVGGGGSIEGGGIRAGVGDKVCLHDMGRDCKFKVLPPERCGTGLENVNVR